MTITSESLSSDYLTVNYCSVQYLNVKDTSVSREHGRVDWHILYIMDGKCYAEINGEDHIVGIGDILLYRPGERQSYRFFMKDESVSCSMHFSGTGCEELMNSIGFNNKSILHIGKSNTIKLIFEKIKTEYILQKPYRNELMTAYTMELFAHIGRRNLARNTAHIKNSKLLDDICVHLHKNYFNEFSLEEYASMCNLSTSRFSHLFKETTGLSPLEYLTDIRIKNAAKLLTHSDMSVAEIAESVGFSDPSYFGRVFKKKMKVSPKKFQSEK